MRTFLVLLTLIMISLAGAVSAADSTFVGWKKTLAIDVTTSQTAYSDSWEGGEAGSLNWVSNLNASAERQFSPIFNFRSQLRLSFGQTVTQDQDTKKWSKPKKATDLIDWDNLGRFTLNKFVDPYLAFRLQSQFTTEFNDFKTVYFSPMTLTESFGIARKFWSRGKNDILISRLGLALREVMTKNLVRDTLVDSTTWGTSNYNTTDGGVESVTDAYVTLSSRLLYTGKLSLYKAIYFSDKSKSAGTEQADDWKAIHVNWENNITAQVSKVITTKLYVQTLYDKTISRRMRIKETLGIGFLFKLI
jgi:hypothetical protein